MAKSFARTRWRAIRTFGQLGIWQSLQYWSRRYYWLIPVLVFGCIWFLREWPIAGWKRGLPRGCGFKTDGTGAFIFAAATFAGLSGEPLRVRRQGKTHLELEIVMRRRGAWFFPAILALALVSGAHGQGSATELLLNKARLLEARAESIWLPRPGSRSWRLNRIGKRR